MKAPLDWLRERREEANYNNSRPSEPQAPPHFRFVASKGVRKTTLAYLSGTWDVYVFDPDHAMLAFPLLFWRDILVRSRTAGLGDVVISELEFLRQVLRDENGPLAEVLRVASTR